MAGLDKLDHRKELAAVIGIGQTHHRAKRLDVSMAGLCREAMDRALEDAGWTEVFAHVMKGGGHGIAPDGLGVALAFMRDRLGLG